MSATANSKPITWICAFATGFVRSWWTRWRIALFRHRASIVGRCSDSNENPSTRVRILIAITHVVAGDVSTERASVYVDRLAQTIDGALSSFGHCDLHIIINTVPSCHLVAHLPSYLQSRIEVVENVACDPM